eukprot:8773073-Lingulodinium_polyedra.AAC.1
MSVARSDGRPGPRRNRGPLRPPGSLGARSAPGSRARARSALCVAPAKPARSICSNGARPWRA